SRANYESTMDDNMRRRVCSVGFRACLAVTLLLMATSATAQLPTTITVSDPRGEVAEILQRGEQLEHQRRWGEALGHYEDAVRQHPQEGQLQQRFDSARLHYDIERRYADRSFRESVLRLPADQALELYSKVLIKMEAHYVELPRWQALVERGTRNLEVALSEPMFLEQNVPSRNREAVEAFRAELRRTLSAAPINSRTDARKAVASAAQLAADRLEIASAAVVLEYLCGATNALDPYSSYLTPDQLNEVYAQIEGSFVGLGVELKALDGGLTIVRVISGSPAEQAGVRSGDRILEVDNRSTDRLTTDQAANMLQGPDGTTVNLLVAGPGQSPRRLDVRRRVVEVPSVDQVSIIDPQSGVGYLRLTCFQKTTARDLDTALWKLHRDGMRSLVVDVRGNPGGLLVSAVEVVDRFVDRGVIVSTRGRSAQEDITYSAHEQGKWRIPLVVIIDQDSASAAEIFAGAIRDHHRGTIVGTRSFGKGSVQGIFPLEETTSGVRLTTAKFYSPAGHAYSHVGVDPDVPVQQVRTTAKPIDGRMPESEDTVLRVAAQTARALSPAQFQARNSQ
ncbi:MAG: S41 family peptidase, partial [Planctomycetaceae bacterium]|nr:S41 family peptidase [Planctomycetaceae bacterium]